MKRCKNYINGAWTESVSGNAAPTFNPATGEELAQVVVSTPEDVDRADPGMAGYGQPDQGRFPAADR